MATQKQIVVTIPLDGDLSIEALGFKGDACAKATAALEKALGTPGNRTKKPEYYQQNAQQQKAGL